MATAKQAMMDVTKIDPSTTNPTSRLRDIEVLAASITNTGAMYEPIVLVKAGRRFTIADGHRRYAAALLLGWTEVPYRLDETKMRPALAQLVTGTQKEKLTPWETAQLVGTLLKEKVKQKEIAEAAGRSEAWVSKLKTIWEASKKAPKLHGDDTLPYTTRSDGGVKDLFAAFTSIDHLYAECQEILQPTPKADPAPAASADSQIDLEEEIDEKKRAELEVLAAKFAEMFGIPADNAVVEEGGDRVSLILQFSDLKILKKLAGRQLA